MSDLQEIRRLTGHITAALEVSRRRIDDLNVYPVPDGDTGTNLTLTVRAVKEALEQLEEDDRGRLAHEIARAALMGARGNSGVILSQIVRGFADVLGEAGTIDSPTLARAFRSASDAAYRAVRKPVEGTMLTVIRELAEEAEAQATADLPVGDLLRALVRRGEDALARTPQYLKVLREAGVVDAGGAGLLELVRGLASGVTGEELPELPAELEAVGFDAVHQELSRYRYCTVFVVEGQGLDAAKLEAELDRLGDSLMVVGDESALKVHVHTDDPGAALSLGVAQGVVEGIEIANMHRQTEEREARLLELVPDAETRSGGGKAATSAPWPAPSSLRRQACEVVAVVAGDGNARLFRSLGATQIVEGGQSMNPSTVEILNAVEAAAPEVVVLPNNPNVILSAEQAAEHASKPVRVVQTRSIPAGIAALVAFDGARSAEENAVAMEEAVALVVTGAVTIASRHVDLNGLAVRKGAYLGLTEGEPVAGGDDFEEVAEAVVEALLVEPRGVLTILTGEGAPALNGLLERLAERHPELEVDVQEGGQPHYHLLLSAE
ncbi:MAG TPA: DAK2 domain-containing protein [Gaiellaceae bacterium]